MLETPVGTNGRTTPPAPAARDGETLREQAVAHLERVRKLKFDAALFAVGILVVGGVWALTEYQNSGGWPARLSEHGNPGDWNPWIAYVVLVWGFLVVLDALKMYRHRPLKEGEIEREVERLAARD